MTFDRGKHRQRRRDDGIAVEQRRADDAEQRDDAGGLADPADRARGQRHQRQRAALAVIVGAQQDEHVFQGDDDEQRPQDQRHARRARCRASSRLAVRVRRGDHRLAQRVKRAGADIAIDDTDTAQEPAPRSRRENALRRCRLPALRSRAGALALSVMNAETGPCLLLMSRRGCRAAPIHPSRCGVMGDAAATVPGAGSRR